MSIDLFWEPGKRGLRVIKKTTTQHLPEKHGGFQEDPGGGSTKIKHQKTC